MEFLFVHVQVFLYFLCSWAYLDAFVHAMTGVSGMSWHNLVENFAFVVVMKGNMSFSYNLSLLRDFRL